MTAGPLTRIPRLLGIRELPPDFYRHIDWGLVVPVGGMLWLLGAAVAVAVMPFLPPTEFVGDAGWVIAGAIVIVAVGAGVAMIAGPRRFTPTAVFAMGCGAGVGLGIAQALIGSGGPFALLFVVLAGYQAILHPPARVRGLVTLLIVVNAASVLVHGVNGLSVVSVATTSVLVLMLSTAALLYAQRVRELLGELDIQRERAEQLARTDPLTGLGNRRALNTWLGDQLALARRYRRPLTVVLLDIDHFKQINDLHGHEVGDVALKTVADALRAEVREPDRSFRWGGDEFLVVLPETTADGAATLVQRLSQKLLASNNGSGGPALAITGGVASAGPTDSLDSLVSRADFALLARKRARHVTRR